MSPDRQSSSGRWQSWLGTLPAVAVALLPTLVCPCSMPAYAALLSSMGLAITLSATYQLRVTLVLLALALTGLAYRAPRRRGYGPLGMGLAAASLLLAGKFIWVWPAAVYGGAALLLAASAWNTWPRLPRPALITAPDALVQLGSCGTRDRETAPDAAHSPARQATD